jgi:plasmid stabilization system protein ParE
LPSDSASTELIADRVRDDLERAFELLATHPEIGRLREELAPEPYRFWPVGPSLVVYRADLKPIQIIHVGRGRDWARILSSA